MYRPQSLGMRPAEELQKRLFNTLSLDSVSMPRDRLQIQHRHSLRGNGWQINERAYRHCMCFEEKEVLIFTSGWYQMFLRSDITATGR